MQHFVDVMKRRFPLRHPNLVTSLGMGRTGSHCWLACEWVDGTNMAKAIGEVAKAGKGDWHPAFRLATHAGRALHFAHGRHMIHRNITPANLMLRAMDNVIKLSDLSLAKALTGSHIRQIMLKKKLEEELPFFAPEQTRANASLDGRTDIYNLGAVVYALISGRPPFLGKSPAETIGLIRDGELPSLHESSSQVPAAFESIIRKMLAKDVEDRFQAPAELLLALARIAPDPA
jgi:serine/threonine-protein kinase